MSIFPAANHPDRRELHDEAHARPPEALAAPNRISFLALLHGSDDRRRQIDPIFELCSRYRAKPPEGNANHFSADLGPFRLKWERHTEFARYEFIVRDEIGEPFSQSAISVVPEDWLQALPGLVIAAAHVAHVQMGSKGPDFDALAMRFFGGNSLIGAYVAEGAGLAVTDFRIHVDGFSRILLFDDHLAPRQAGRTVQRLLEIDAYRVLALLALPIARELLPTLSVAETELAGISAGMASEQAIDETGLLDRLTRLEARIQQRHFETSSRFSAAEAYYRLVQRRIEELREHRIAGMQTFREFIERRLAPAMGTCSSVSARQEKLSLRVAQTTQLLSTRVDVSTQRQSRAVLESMNRRALLQLRLQQTVEGLSIAAITYYVVGLVAYLAKGLAAMGIARKADQFVAVSVPIVFGLVAFGVRRIKKSFGGRQSVGSAERTPSD